MNHNIIKNRLSFIVFFFKVDFRAVQWKHSMSINFRSIKVFLCVEMVFVYIINIDFVFDKMY